MSWLFKGLIMIALFPIVVWVSIKIIVPLLPVEKPKVVPVDLNMTMIDKISLSMKLSDVKTIIGCEPSQIVEPGNSHKSPGYYWTDTEGDTIWISAPHGIVDKFSWSGNDMENDTVKPTKPTKKSSES